LLKKLRHFIAFGLITLILLNVVGYYVILVGLRYQASQNLVKQLDAGGIDNDETITLSVPLTIPYFNRPDEENRIDGEFEHQGNLYRLVSQRVSRDTLYITYITDKKGSSIREVIADYVQTFTDVPSDYQFVKIPAFVKDYLPTSLSLLNEYCGWALAINFSVVNETESTDFFSSISPPPKA
jgi:hypothetical protein